MRVVQRKVGRLSLRVLDAEQTLALIYKAA